LIIVSKTEQAVLLEFLRACRARLFNYPGVHYVDIGYKYVQSRLTPELAVRLHVYRKKPRSVLPVSEILPIRIKAIPTDVIQSNRRLESTTGVIRDIRVNPLIGGVAIRNLRNNLLGTLGVIVTDRATGALMGLSNYHVLVGETGQKGDSVTQPATTYITDIIGTVDHWDQTLDCAVCTLNSSRLLSRRIIDIPAIPPGIKEPLLGMKVIKSGRTTGKTFGIIDGVSEDEFTIIPVGGVNNLANEEISAPGDSGSLWLEAEGYCAIGLHYAGEKDPSPQSERAWAKKFGKVAEALDISIP
jgi:hypothetical protein